MCWCCNAEVEFHCVGESRCGRVVVRSRYCGCSIGIVDVKMRSLEVSMSRFEGGSRLGG